MTSDFPDRVTVLIARLGSRLCALPLECVIECLRPLPVEAVPGTPPFLLGLSVIRGSPVPVVDLNALVGGSCDSRPTRFVLLRLGPRRVALAASGVVGVRRLGGEALRALPPLLHGAGDETVAAIGVLDEQLLFLLQPARIVPDDVWHTFDSGGERT
jgi:purine-binding chemotaxis protein CheW